MFFTGNYKYPMKIMLLWCSLHMSSCCPCESGGGKLCFETLQYSFYVVVAVLFYIYFSLFPSLLNRMMVYSLKAWMGALDCVEKRTKGMI